MKTFTLIITFLLLSLSYFSTNAYFYSDYYSESISHFINSPSIDDLEKIEDNRLKNCERVYLEVTRRRDYSESELYICSDIFEIKRQEEFDYMTYMLRNRGIY